MSEAREREHEARRRATAERDARTHRLMTAMQAVMAVALTALLVMGLVSQSPPPWPVMLPLTLGAWWFVLDALLVD